MDTSPSSEQRLSAKKTRALFSRSMRLPRDVLDLPTAGSQLPRRTPRPGRQRPCIDSPPHCLHFAGEIRSFTKPRRQSTRFRLTPRLGQPNNQLAKATLETSCHLTPDRPFAQLTKITGPSRPRSKSLKPAGLRGLGPSHPAGWTKMRAGCKRRINRRALAPHTTNGDESSRGRRNPKHLLFAVMEPPSSRTVQSLKQELCPSASAGVGKRPLSTTREAVFLTLKGGKAC